MFRSIRDEVTYRICLLTDAQERTLLDFLLLDTPNTLATVEEVEMCSPSITVDETNTCCVDPEEPIRWTGMCRDQWERAMPPLEWMGDGRASCVYKFPELPTKANQDDAKRRWKCRTDRR
ncbi:hypothetical protein N8I77_005855 [Diaporthe amygdali]|uniref:Uncharacterized protein n=1 Tax=Phomopsis amygdali TaxID=1214568 RepID=A0AAD9SGV8_PHOAM|nr:hypothetical protein N8I77_005855 [Diaporthe amygdali]